MLRQFFNYYPKFVNVLITLIVVLFISGLGFVSPVSAQASKNAVCGGVNTATGGNGTTNCPKSNGDLDKILREILMVISLIAGFIAVLMIIIGGFKYVVSGGNDSAVASAKNTILYALVGVIVVAVSQLIIHLVLGNIK